MDQYQLLANAIVLRAAKDYRRILRHYKKYPNSSKYKWERKDLEDFFQSGWFGVLTNLDGVLLMQKLQEQVLGKVVEV